MHRFDALILKYLKATGGLLQHRRLLDCILCVLYYSNLWFKDFTEH